MAMPSTAGAAQRYLRIAHPCAGALYEDRVHHEEAAVPFAEHWRPGVECEIAVRLGRSLPAADVHFDRTSVAAAVESCMAAIEIVDDRYDDFRALDAPTLIADDFFSAGAVVGGSARGWRELDLRALRDVHRRADRHRRPPRPQARPESPVTQVSPTSPSADATHPNPMRSCSRRRFRPIRWSRRSS